MKRQYNSRPVFSRRLLHEQTFILALLLLLSRSLAWTSAATRPSVLLKETPSGPLSSSSRLSVSISGDGSSSSESTDNASPSDDPCATAASPANGVVSWNWQAVAQSAFAKDARPIILFDGVCLFCNAGVDLCLNLDRQEKFRFASLQSKVGQSLLLQHGKAANDLSSIVLVESPTVAYFESNAILRIAKELKGLPGLVRVLSSLSLKVVPVPVRNAAYHVVANNRYLFGHTEECRLDLDGVLARRFVEEPTDENEMMQEASANAAAL